MSVDAVFLRGGCRASKMEIRLSRSGTLPDVQRADLEPKWFLKVQVGIFPGGSSRV
jgi:hypothetical protein